VSKKIFIDGKAGTTGLRIYERLCERRDIDILTLSDEDRKNTEKRKEALNACDIAFLCLPDDAAIEAVGLVENPDVAIIDASTAHRTNEAWAYGFPELSEKFEKNLVISKRISNPGCHASGFIALVYPLIEAGVLPADAMLTCHSITGYSGGGKKMIAEYEADELEFMLGAPRQYGITQQHKHLKEMKKITGIANAPVFCPIVSNFYSGMTVTVPIFASQLANGKTVKDIKEIYSERYSGDIVKYVESFDECGFISAHAMAKKDSMKITVCGNEERILLISSYDNLGKGASGAAVECMNLLLGVDRATGLVL